MVYKYKYKSDVRRPKIIMATILYLLLLVVQFLILLPNQLRDPDIININRFIFGCKMKAQHDLVNKLMKTVLNTHIFITVKTSEYFLTRTNCCGKSKSMELIRNSMKMKSCNTTRIISCYIGPLILRSIMQWTGQISLTYWNRLILTLPARSNVQPLLLMKVKSTVCGRMKRI